MLERRIENLVTTYICLTVRLHICEVILVTAEPQAEASLLPELLKVCFSLFGGIVELYFSSVSGNNVDHGGDTDCIALL